MKSSEYNKRFYYNNPGSFFCCCDSHFSHQRRCSTDPPRHTNSLHVSSRKNKLSTQLNTDPTPQTPRYCVCVCVHMELRSLRCRSGVALHNSVQSTRTFKSASSTRGNLSVFGSISPESVPSGFPGESSPAPQVVCGFHKKCLRHSVMSLLRSVDLLPLVFLISIKVTSPLDVC